MSAVNFVRFLYIHLFIIYLLINLFYYLYIYLFIYSFINHLFDFSFYNTKLGVKQFLHLNQIVTFLYEQIVNSENVGSTWGMFRTHAG